MPKALELNNIPNVGFDNYKSLYPIGITTESYANYKILKSLFNQDYIVCRTYHTHYVNAKSYEIRFINEESLNLFLLMVPNTNSIQRIE